MNPKRLLLLLLILFATAVFIPELKAQRFLGGVSLGMNLTQVDGDEFYGFSHVGLNVGPQVSLPFGPKKTWSVSMELLYSQKGSHHTGNTDSTKFNMTLDYIEVPVLIHYTDKNLISAGLGFSYGQLANYKETRNSFFDSLYTYTTSLSNYDIAVVADFQVRVWSKLWAGVRYQYSMKSIRTVEVHDPRVYPRMTETRYQYNNVITIRVTWVFNQPKIAGGKNRSQDQ